MLLNLSKPWSPYLYGSGSSTSLLELLEWNQMCRGQSTWPTGTIAVTFAFIRIKTSNPTSMLLHTLLLICNNLKYFLKAKLMPI